ncbi:MAG: hypothetical protein AUJ72_04175 [Candidatus Omnitrophica bacterium CG1_02_46_14]|nr:MAG: hypothetical protein AUJ72_04175 [Candidatus Omnitrophica bacterium CG1_02_46_14]
MLYPYLSQHVIARSNSDEACLSLPAGRHGGRQAIPSPKATLRVEIASLRLLRQTTFAMTNGFTH